MKKPMLLSAAHFCVDMCCAALFFGYLGQDTHWWLSMVFYNACAFALQLPLGLLVDKLDRNLPFAAAGCLLIGVSFLLTNVPLLAAVVCGIGNGMFHVGGGLEVLNGSVNAAPLGVFVSPGALGLYVGTVYASVFIRFSWLPLLIMAGFAILLVGMPMLPGAQASHNAPLSLSLPKKEALPLLCLFWVVALRSFLGGKAFRTELPDLPGCIPVLALALGKAAGGFIGDRLGFRSAAVLSLGVASVLLLLPRGYATLIALLLFNMTMPLTLFEAARRLPGAKGGAFGLLTCALFVGMIPQFASLSPVLPAYGWAGLVLLSLGLLMMGLRKGNEHG